MRTEDFDYELPADRIAQHPARDRSGSRLMVLDRRDRSILHQTFDQFPDQLRPGDCLVINNTRVLKARLYAQNPRTGGRFELLLLNSAATNDWWVLLRPGKRARLGTEMVLVDADGNATSIQARVEEINEEGHRRLKFSGTENLLQELEWLGQIPLPPYIERAPTDRSLEDQERYQTVYARAMGSVAAPTAGLHFTSAIFSRLRERGVEVVELTLHVGLGTFAPVKAERLEEHRMHEEHFEISGQAVGTMERVKKNSGRVVAVGTTSLRALESAVDAEGKLRAGAGRTRLFFYPPARFRVVDALLTNFHLPRSTLLMLVSAFASPGKSDGREWVLAAYREAIEQKYRFFSYGDAMLLR